MRGSRPRPALDSAAVPVFKPAYLVLGDDHGRIAERRAKLRALAEAESGAAASRCSRATRCTADAVIGALTTMTFAMGRRFVIADGVERWKDADVEAVAAAMAGHGRRDAHASPCSAARRGATRSPTALRKAVEAAGGVVAEEGAVKPWKLPGWVQARARELGLELDNAGAKALIAQVGDRQQRLLRELEKLALEHGQGAAIGVAEIEASSASSAERKAWTLADALVAGDEQAAMRALVELRGQGERLPGLLYQIVRRLRDARRGRGGARRRPGARAGPQGAADAAEGGRAAHRRRRRARRRRLPARARGDGRPRAREPRRRRRAAARSARRRRPSGRAWLRRRARRSAARRTRLGATALRRRACDARRGTSCGRRSSGAARRA